MTRLETYQEGIAFLHKALGLLDQADACMRDVRMNDVIQATGYRKPTLKQAVSDLISICQEAESWECGECGRQIMDHEEGSPDCGWWNNKPYEAKGWKQTMVEAKLAVAAAKTKTPASLQQNFISMIEFSPDGGYDWNWRWNPNVQWDFAKIREERYA